MATTIPEWVPKFIRQVVAYREEQKVTHERLNELFNLLIVQGDWNTETIQTLLANLKSFDLQYIADLDGMSADYVALVSTFNNTINQIKQENTSNIAALDLQQRQLMAEQLVTFQADLADTETAINTMLTDKLGAIQILHDEMLAQSDFFNTEMADLRLTVDTLRETILDDNQAIADKIAADKLAIENMIAISQETVQHASELTQAITNLETTTAESSNKLTSRVLYKRKTIKPVVTFVDDDGHRDIYYKLKPIAESKGVPFSVAIVTGWFDKPEFNTVTREQLDELVFSTGFEVLGHGVEYTNNLGEFTVDADLDYQLGEGCKGYLESRGYKVNGFVYPQGHSDERIRRFMQKYYDFSFGGTGINTDLMLNTNNVNRIAYVNYTTTNPTINGNSEQNTLAYYKACVDYTVENNGWLTFMMHCHEYTDTQFAELEQLIDYIHAQGAEVLNASEAHEIHGNKVFAGDVETNKYFAIDKFGESHSSNIEVKEGIRDGVLPSTPPKDYAVNSITYNEIGYSHGNSNAFPNGTGGTLITTRQDDAALHQFNFQDYLTQGSYHSRFRRYAVDADNWSEWVNVGITSVVPINKYSAADSASDFPIGETWCEISATHPDRSGFPTSALGYFKNVRIGTGTNGVYQEFHNRASYEIWKRTWVAGAWSEWKKVNGFNYGSTLPSEPFWGEQFYNSSTKQTSYYNGASWVPMGVFKNFVEGYPTSPAAPGEKGDFCADANYFYVCYDTNSWIRVTKDSTW